MRTVLYERPFDGPAFKWGLLRYLIYLITLIYVSHQYEFLNYIFDCISSGNKDTQTSVLSYNNIPNGALAIFLSGNLYHIFHKNNSLKRYKLIFILSANIHFIENYYYYVIVHARSYLGVS